MPVPQNYMLYDSSYLTLGDDTITEKELIHGCQRSERRWGQEGTQCSWKSIKKDPCIGGNVLYVGNMGGNIVFCKMSALEEAE